MSGIICNICKKAIEKGATTVGVMDKTAHFDCAINNPGAFAKMMDLKLPGPKGKTTP